MARLPVMSTSPIILRKPSCTTTLPFLNTATLESVPAVTSDPTMSCVPTFKLEENVFPEIFKTLDAFWSIKNVPELVLSVSDTNTFVAKTLPFTITRSWRDVSIEKSLTPT